MARWGLGYFRVNQEGHVTAHPGLESAEGIDLHRLASLVKIARTDDASAMYEAVPHAVAAFKMRLAR